MVFPCEGQDIESVDDVRARLSPEQIALAFGGVWNRRIKKPDAMGIHGTLFYELDFKKEYYPNNSEMDVWGPPHSAKLDEEYDPQPVSSIPAK